MCAGRLTCDLPSLHREWHLYSYSPCCIFTFFLTFLFVSLSLYLYLFESCICVALYVYLFDICIYVALYFNPFDICICVTLYFYRFVICICVALLWKSPLDMPWRARAHLWQACTKIMNLCTVLDYLTFSLILVTFY